MSRFGLCSAVKAIHEILLPKLFRVIGWTWWLMVVYRLDLVILGLFSNLDVSLVLWWHSQYYIPSLSIFIVQLPNGSHLLLRRWLNKCSEAVLSLSVSLCACKELDKVTVSNLCPRSSQPAPGAREISPEASPTVPNLGTGSDRVSREAAVWVLRCGVTAQEAGWDCLRPWGYPAVPLEGAVPVGKIWLTCVRLHGGTCRAGEATVSVLTTCYTPNPSSLFRGTKDREATVTTWELLWYSSLLKELTELHLSLHLAVTFL